LTVETKGKKKKKKKKKIYWGEWKRLNIVGNWLWVAGRRQGLKARSARKKTRGRRW